MDVNIPTQNDNTAVDCSTDINITRQGGQVTIDEGTILDGDSTSQNRDIAALDFAGPEDVFLSGDDSVQRSNAIADWGCEDASERKRKSDEQPSQTDPFQPFHSILLP
jgi:hypothetical protein